jgi:hypothetical protein
MGFAWVFTREVAEDAARLEEADIWGPFHKPSLVKINFFNAKAKAKGSLPSTSPNTRAYPKFHSSPEISPVYLGESHNETIGCLIGMNIQVSSLERLW